MWKLRLLIPVLGLLLSSTYVFAAESHFKAKMSGNEEIPKVTTEAKGEAEVTISKDYGDMTYKIKVKNIENAIAAHIHQGKKGESGPPVVDLMHGKKQGKFSGTIAQGKLIASDLTGPLQGKTLKELEQMIKDGNAYVNVHTDKNPNGEIRGELK